MSLSLGTEKVSVHHRRLPAVIDIFIRDGWASPASATSRSFSAQRSLLMAASRFRAADFDRWGSL